MNKAVSFRGRSGKAWGFERVSADSPWARGPGIAIFAAQEACGWRLIRVIELSGRTHDVRPIWAYAEAERYGASAVFVTSEFDADIRAYISADIEAGFSPVCRAESPVRLAA